MEMRIYVCTWWYFLKFVVDEVNLSELCVLVGYLHIKRLVRYVLTYVLCTESTVYCVFTITYIHSYYCFNQIT